MQSDPAEPDSEDARLGIDAGSLNVKVALVGASGRPARTGCRAHEGDVLGALKDLIRELGPPPTLRNVGLVGAHAPAVGKALGIVPGDLMAATLRAVRARHPGARLVMDLGGGSVSLIELNEQGGLVRYQTNSLCAAGTGSFLDEQAARLGLGHEEAAALAHVEEPPGIAARCAVFAKSDLIHRQQEGYGKPALWAGLCRGLSHGILSTLLRGRSARGVVVVVGGVARNLEVLRWLERELPDGIAVPDDPHLLSAWGAALEARALGRPLAWGGLGKGKNGRSTAALRPPLRLVRSRYPTFEVEESSIDEDGNEIRVTRWPGGETLRGYVGIDVGSTSTKLLLTGEHDEVVVDVYRRTAGDPLGATRSLLRALRTVSEARGATLEVLGVGTTGSGRKLVGAVIGADSVVNEITAHVTGALHVDPGIETIFEIGGQDAKFVHVHEGRLRDANLNYACAAGTGSFVEELARKLGFRIEEVGDAVLGVVPPVTSDRCTVFMEQDAQRYLRLGYSAREVMGAVLYSVVQNYLSKVVGHRHRSRERVFFQGATARNKALAAAMEGLLDVEVVVSPYCHVMGAWGAALLTRRKMEREGRTSRFLGMDLADRQVALSSETCELCTNVCRITRARVEGRTEETSWGYLCGREPEEDRARPNPHFEAFRQRERLWRQARAEGPSLPAGAPRIGMPRALLAHSFEPLWRRFFAELGYRLVLSKPTGPETVEGAVDWVSAEYCFPVKLAHGHVRQLLEDPATERVFLPYMVSAGDSPRTTESYFCPYNVALPGIVGSAVSLQGLDEDRLLRATLDLRWSDSTTARRLHRDLGPALDRSRGQIARAWTAALEAHTALGRALRDEGTRALREIVAEGRPAVILLARPYTAHDPGANLRLPEKLASLGLTVLPMEMLPLDEEELGAEFHNMFWDYGRHMLEAARLVARTENLYAVHLTNFACGPDSFVQTYVQEIMGAKPLLLLELDEHGADAGYVTRLEAFADVIAQNGTQSVPRYELVEPPADHAALSGRVLWLPPMADPGAAFLAATFRRYGHDARVLPLENEASFQRGRALVQGGECLPCPSTLGTFVAAVEAEGTDPSRHAFFMPSADGPCRFGQYCTLHRIALDRLGWRDTPILSWRSEETYAAEGTPARRHMWAAILIADLLVKARCRVAPYEREPGQSEELFQAWAARLIPLLESGDDLREAVAAMRDDFLAVPRREGVRPLVGIVGEIYVRNNRFTNQDLVRRIEAAGGEAWLTPLSEWFRYLSYMETWVPRHRWATLRGVVPAFLQSTWLGWDERQWMHRMSPLLDERHEPPVEAVVERGSRHLPVDFEGEAILTVGRAAEFMDAGAALVVNCAPFGCMPGTLTAGILQQLAVENGVPVANLVYDGEREVNDVLEVYLRGSRSRPEQAGASPSSTPQGTA